MTESKPESKRAGFLGALKGGMDKITSQLQEPGSLQHTLRQQAVQYNPNQPQDTLKLQLAIKSSAAAVRDMESLGRDLQHTSKDLYLWGQAEQGKDLQDVSDRLAFLVFKTGELQKQSALACAQARSAMKDIRNFENELVPRRKARDSMSTKLTALQNSSKSNPENAAKLQAELDAANKALADSETQLEQLRRSKLQESWSLWFSAQRELGEKQAIVASYGELLLQGMDSHGYGEQYSGQEKSAQIKAEVSASLARYSPSAPLIPTPQLKSDGSSYLGRADTGSFGSTHAAELSSLHEETSGNHATESRPWSYDTSYTAYHGSHGSSKSSSHASALPGRVLAPIPGGVTPAEGSTPGGTTAAAADPFSNPTSHTQASRPVPITQLHASSSSGLGTSPNTGRLNLSPTPHDLGASYSPKGSAYPVEPFDAAAAASLPSAGPTVAETGATIPVGTGGPVTGQLSPRPSSSSSAGTFGAGHAVPGAFPSAAEEKRRMEQSQVDQANAGVSSSHDGGNELPPPTYTDGTAGSSADAEAQRILAEERERKIGGPSLT